MPGPPQGFDWNRAQEIIHWDVAHGASQNILGDLQSQLGWAPTPDELAHVVRIAQWDIAQGAPGNILGDIQSQLGWQVTGGPATPAAPTPPPLTDTQRSARAALNGFLEQYGLQTLGDWVWQKYLDGDPIEQIMLDIRGRDEYKQRFPAMDMLAQKGRAMSEAEYIAYEKQVSGMMVAAGFPEGFYDQPGDFKELIGGEVSANEVSQRLQDWLNFASTAPTENILNLERFYGVGIGGVAAYFMNPERALPLLERQANAALIGSGAQRTGYGDLSQQEAEYVGGFGYQPQATAEGFTTLAQQRELFGPLEGGEDVIDRQAQLSAMFGGDAEARRRLEERTARRLAKFGSGGGFSTGREGISGVGTAR